MTSSDSQIMHAVEGSAPDALDPAAADEALEPIAPVIDETLESAKTLMKALRANYRAILQLAETMASHQTSGPGFHRLNAYAAAADDVRSRAELVYRQLRRSPNADRSSWLRELTEAAGEVADVTSAARALV